MLLSWLRGTRHIGSSGSREPSKFQGYLIEQRGLLRSHAQRRMLPPYARGMPLLTLVLLVSFVESHDDERQERTTENLSKKQIIERQNEFGIAFAVCLALLSLFAIYSIFKKAKGISIGVLSFNSSGELRWGESILFTVRSPVFTKSSYDPLPASQEEPLVERPIDIENGKSKVDAKKKEKKRAAKIADTSYLSQVFQLQRFKNADGERPGREAWVTYCREANHKIGKHGGAEENAREYPEWFLMHFLEKNVSLMQLMSSEGKAVDNNDTIVAIKEALQEKTKSFRANRRLCLIMLYILYVGASIGIPWYSASGASCSGGYFWEPHMLFFGIFMFTKIVELYLYANDPSLDGELTCVDFCLRFFPSFLAYADGYTDATSFVIANSCDDRFAKRLAFFMAITYVCGVILGQWTIVAFMASQDPSQACLMKLVHMDTISACVSMPETSTDGAWYSPSAKTTWNALHLIRTFGEDIPQAVLQALFVVYVKENYFMILSICVGVLASLKAVRDAFFRLLEATGAQEVLEKQLREPVAGEQVIVTGFEPAIFRKKVRGLYKVEYEDGTSYHVDREGFIFP